MIKTTYKHQILTGQQYIKTKNLQLPTTNWKSVIKRSYLHWKSVRNPIFFIGKVYSIWYLCLCLSKLSQVKTTNGTMHFPM